MELNELIKEINLARSDPKSYANKVIYQMSYLSVGDNKITLPTQEVIEIKEGFKAFHQAITHLKQSSPLGPVVLNVPLSFISVNEALTKAKECGLSAEFNRSTERFKRYGTYDYISEITFITEAVNSEDYESIVTQLLVSDGDDTRMNRTILLNPDLNMIGLGKSNYDNHKILITIIMAKNWGINRPLQEEWNNDVIYNHHQEDKEQLILREIDKYEKALEAKITNEYQYKSINEERKLFKDNDKIKLIKQYHLVLEEGNIKKSLVFSKSFYF